MAAHVNIRTQKHARDTANPVPGLNGQGDCESPEPANTVTDRLNSLLAQGGPGYTLRLCPSANYIITAPIKYAANHQEISTVGYPTDEKRAMLTVMGSVNTQTPHTTAVDGMCLDCSGIKLRNIQIDGTRRGAPPTVGGGNIEFGGSNQNQLIEYVRSFDPRSWTCLHVAEGPLTCNNATIQNNDIGPCGSDEFQQWSDGISLSCKNSLVRNNLIGGATDGGIVVFGSPGSVIENNRIWAVNHTLLGGINLVDYDPWAGNYTDVLVRKNTILGGFADDLHEAEVNQTKGESDEDVIIKIGIAIGPRTWFGPRFLTNVSANGTVKDNRFSGAFGYAIAITSSANFDVTGNTLFGNVSFIGSRGPNCSQEDTTPTPSPFVIDRNNTRDVTAQSDFQSIPDGDALNCIVPPDGGDYWPYRPSGDPNSSSGDNGLQAGPNGGDGGGSSPGRTAGIVLGVLGGIALVGVAAFFIRRWALKRRPVTPGVARSDTRQFMLQKDH